MPCFVALRRPLASPKHDEGGPEVLDSALYMLSEAPKIYRFSMDWTDFWIYTVSSQCRFFTIFNINDEGDIMGNAIDRGKMYAITDAGYRIFKALF